jgi:hypothetical protein
VATGEDHPQPVVDYLVGIDIGGHLSTFELTGNGGEPGVEGAAAAQAVDGLEAPSRYEPGEWLRRLSFHRPSFDSSSKCVLQRLRGEIEIAEEADQRGENATRFGTVERLDPVVHRVSPALVDQPSPNSMIGRTSMEPYRAPGMRAATWIASFKSLALII